jgi:hypothetical protein
MDTYSYPLLAHPEMADLVKDAVFVGARIRGGEIEAAEAARLHGFVAR